MRFPARISARYLGALGLAAQLGVTAVHAGAVAAQEAATAHTTQQVSYRNAEDSTYLTAALTLPAGRGPHPGVVLLSIAGTADLIDRLAREGYAVLLPIRRGFLEVEPLLQATYQDLASDAQSALDYLRSRPDIAAGSVAMIGQNDDAPAAMLSSAAAAEGVPLVLLAPPAFPGREMFRLEQRSLGEADRRTPEQLDELDRFVNGIADIVLGATLSNLRSYRLTALMGSSRVQLPYNAAFPNDERQIHFFSSPIWYDRLAFAPEEVLARLHSPVLLVIGNEDASTPLTAYLAAVRRGLAGGRTQDATVCLIQGRARHSFTRVEVDAIVTWLSGRVARPGGQAPRPGPLTGCLPDPPPS